MVVTAVYIHQMIYMVNELHAINLNCLNKAALKKQPLGGVTEHPRCPVFRAPRDPDERPG